MRDGKVMMVRSQQVGRCSRLGLVAAAAGILLGACAERGDLTASITPSDVRERHPIVLRDAPRSLDVFVGRAGAPLDPRQAEDVTEFAQEYRRSGRGGLVAQVPSGTRRDIAAHVRRDAEALGAVEFAHRRLAAHPALRGPSVGPSQVPRLRPSRATCRVFASVRKAAEEMAAKLGEVVLDALVNNAGVMALADIATGDGYDVQMQTNHLSHFLLTRELWPLLEKAAEVRGEARVVNHSSLARMGKVLDARYLKRNGGALGGIKLKVRHASDGLGSQAAVLGVHLGQRLGEGRLHIELGRLMAVGAPESLIELGAFLLEFEDGRATAEAVQIERLEAVAQVDGKMGRLLFAHGRARHATGGAAVERGAKKLNEVGVRVLGSELAERNVAPVVLGIRRVALGTA